MDLSGWNVSLECTGMDFSSPTREILLKELDGWSVAEIAAALRCREKRVHNELYRARRALAAWRRRDAQEGGPQ